MGEAMTCGEGFSLPPESRTGMRSHLILRREGAGQDSRHRLGAGRLPVGCRNFVAGIGIHAGLDEKNRKAVRNDSCHCFRGLRKMRPLRTAYRCSEKGIGSLMAVCPSSLWRLRMTSRQTAPPNPLAT